MVVKQEKVAFEDALRMTGFGKFNILAFMLCSSIIVGMVFEIFSVSYLAPGSSCELLTSSSQQGMIAAMPLVGIILTSHWWGYLADTKGRRRVLVMSMSLCFISGSLAALSPNWIMLTILKLFSSSSVSGAYALSITLMSEYTPLEKRSTLVLLTTTVFFICSGLMAVISIPILPLKFSYHIPYLDIQFNSWRMLALIFTLPSIIGAIGVSCSYESPKYLLGVGKHDQAVEVLKKIFAMNSGKDKELYRANSIVLDEENKAHVEGFWSSIKAQTLPMLKPPLLKDTLLFSLLMFLLYICTNPYMVWMPFIVNAAMTSVENGDVNLTLCEMIRQNRNSSSIEQSTECSTNKFAMLVVCGISVIIALLNLVSSGVTRLLGRKALFIGFQMVGGAAAIYINISTNWVLIAFCFMVYLSGIINFASLTSYCVDTFPTYVKAMAVCLTLMVGRASAAIGINVVKWLLDVNCEAGFYFFGALYFAGGLFGLLLPTEKKILQRKEELKIKLTNGIQAE